MDEEKKTDIMETNAPPSPPPAPLTWRDGAAPVLALALAWLFWECFDPVRLGDFGFPHLGVLILVCTHFAAVFLILGRRARLSAGGLFCAAAALALGVSCTLYASDVFLLLNCFVILLAAAMGTFALSGRLVPGRPEVLWDTVRLSFAAFFTRLGAPFRILRRASRGDRRRLGTTVLAILAAVPVLAVVLWLLASADAVFGAFFDRFDLTELPTGLFTHVLRVLILALFVCSALVFIREDAPAKPAPHGGKQRSATLFLPVTVLLDLVYVIFCYIQIKYLFGSAEEASMSGGWAEYARSGFFQLVTITFINLGLFLLGTDEGRFASRGGKLLRALLGLLLGLTAVILVSAFWRMRLYILAFGMSVLRLLTLWAMAVICFGLLTAAWKLLRPGFGFFRVAGGFALVLWCVLNLAGPGRMIAGYNVDKYLTGELSEADTYYLYGLGADALPALEKLDDAGKLDKAHLITRLRQESASWAPWPQRTLPGHRTEKTAPILFDTAETGGYRTILWEGRTYAPYGILADGRIALGATLGRLREDEESIVYAVGTADTDCWLAEYTNEGWMDDPPMVYRALDAPANVPVPDGTESLGYDIWK